MADVSGKENLDKPLLLWANWFCKKKKKMNKGTEMTLSFQRDRFGQTVQNQIRQLMKGQSDEGLHCLLFPLHLFGCITPK